MRLALCILLLLLAHSTRAATYYVSSGGDDGNPGTYASPFATLQAGFNVVSAGDTVVLLAGTYSADATTAANGTVLYPITILGSNAPVVTGSVTLQNSYYVVKDVSWQCANPAFTGRINFSTTNCHDNLILSNRWSAIYNGINFGGDSPQWTNGCHNNTVRGCVLSNCIDQEMISWAGYSNTVEQCLLVDSHGWDALRVFGARHIIRSNTFNNISTDGGNPNHCDTIQTFSNNGEECHEIVFEQNTLANCNAQLGNLEDTNTNNAVHDIVFRNNLFIGGEMQMNVCAPRTMFYNNTWVGCGSSTIVAFRNDRGGSAGSQFYNNILFGCGSPATSANQGIIGDMDNAGEDHDYNFYAGPSGETKSISEGHGINGGFPGLVSTNSPYDPHLQSGSVCIGAGMNLSSLFTVDKDGKPRGSMWDIGAYQYATPAPITLRATTLRVGQIISR